MGADRNRNRRAAFRGEFQSAVPGSAPCSRDVPRRDAAGDKDTQLAVLRKQPVGFAQARRGTDLRRLLTAAGREQCQLALSLQVDELDVEFARGRSEERRVGK